MHLQIGKIQPFYASGQYDLRFLVQYRCRRTAPCFLPCLQLGTNYASACLFTWMITIGSTLQLRICPSKEANNFLLVLIPIEKAGKYKNVKLVSP